MSTETQVGAPVASAGAGPLLRVRGVSKRFGPVQVLSDVDFEIAAGEVVALVGDNGAGKSTFIKTLSGVGPADAGTFEFDGTEVSIRSPQDAADLGIAVVYQDLALCDNLDVVANLYLGHEASTGPVMNEIAMEKRALELLDYMQVKTVKSVRIEAGSLSGGQRQSVAIADNLKKRGLAVILISHNLGDVFQVADRVSVLRLGNISGEFAPSEENRNAIVGAITGAAGGVIRPARSQEAP